jgi:Arm DNA-binding domain/Phage integrase central domain
MPSFASIWRKTWKATGEAAQIEQGGAHDMAIHRLKPNFIETVTRAGKYPDGDGLYLRVGEGGGAKSWIFRYSRSRFGKSGEAEMGLGPTHTIGLHDAREMARECRQQLHRGIDPMEARKADRIAKQLEAAKQVTFEFCAEEYRAFKVKTKQWSSPKTVKLGEFLIREYLNPELGKLPITMIDHLRLHQVLKPIKEKTPATFHKVHVHLVAILDRANAFGYRTGDNPASMKGPLGVLLDGAAHEEKHHASLPYQEISTFMQDLRAFRATNIGCRESVPAYLLQFIILTAVRTAEARAMRWDEIKWQDETVDLLIRTSEDPQRVDRAFE